MMKEMSNSEKIAYDAICAYVGFLNEAKPKNVKLKLACTSVLKYQIASYTNVGFRLPCVMSIGYSYKTYAGLLKAMLKFKEPYFYSISDNRQYIVNYPRPIIEFGSSAEEINVKFDLKNMIDE